MPDRYGDPNPHRDPVVDFDSRRQARDTAAKAEAERQERQRLADSRAVHAPLNSDQAAALRQHRNHVTDEAEARRNAIRRANCRMCNDDGYRGAIVCDHTDRTEIAKRGSARCREALAAIKAKRKNNG